MRKCRFKGLCHLEYVPRNIHTVRVLQWWRHQMKTFSALLALCAGNSPVTGEFLPQRPVTQRFDVFFDLHRNKRSSKQLWGWWFETPSRSLWRHCNDTTRFHHYPWGLLHLYWRNAPVVVKKHWRIWVNNFQGSNCILEMIEWPMWPPFWVAITEKVVPQKEHINTLLSIL